MKVVNCQSLLVMVIVMMEITMKDVTMMVEIVAPLLHLQKAGMPIAQLVNV